MSPRAANSQIWGRERPAALRGRRPIARITFHDRGPGDRVRAISESGEKCPRGAISPPPEAAGSGVENPASRISVALPQGLRPPSGTLCGAASLPITGGLSVGVHQVFVSVRPSFALLALLGRVVAWGDVVFHGFHPGGGGASRFLGSLFVRAAVTIAAPPTLASVGVRPRPKIKGAVNLSIRCISLVSTRPRQRA